MSEGPPAIELSIVIPAFNEAKRLPPFLKQVTTYCQQSLSGRWEAIVVDDGGEDDLAGALQGMAPQVAIVRHPANRGKGAALRTGFAAARGRLVLFADADGATPIAEEAKLRAAIGGGAALAIGSRLVADAKVTRERTNERGLGGRVFAAVARRALALPFLDTQCGFKMLDRERCREAVERCREDGFLFDLELLGRLQRERSPVAEIAVNWREQPGSKLRPWRDGLRMLAGLARVRRNVRAMAEPAAREKPAALA